MRSALLVLSLTVGVLTAASVSPVTAAADPASPNVTGESEGHDSVYVEAHVPGSPGKTTAPKPGKPTTKVTVQPVCESFEVGSTNRGDIICEAHQCPNDEQQYIRTVEDLEGGLIDSEHFCGLPDRDPGTLAVAEFHSKKLTVSYPTIAPHTNTLVNFPNIVWSDVVTYEEGTDITVADVRLKFIPKQYVWEFGDGETMTLTEPGKPYDPKLTQTLSDVKKNYTNTYKYRKLGTFDVTLTVIFNGQYSVNGGGWIDIAGSVQATSPAHPLTVREARAELILPDRN